VRLGSKKWPIFGGLTLAALNIPCLPGQGVDFGWAATSWKLDRHVFSR